MQNLYKRDGLDVIKQTRTEAISWIRRVREDLREVETILKSSDHAADLADQLQHMMAMAQDAAGAAAELQNIAETTWEEQVKQS